MRIVVLTHCKWFLGYYLGSIFEIQKNILTFNSIFYTYEKYKLIRSSNSDDNDFLCQ